MRVASLSPPRERADAHCQCRCRARRSERTRGAVEEASRLAPLHNPPSLHCIDAARSLFPDSPHVS